MKFVQTIEFHTSHIDECNALMDEWAQAATARQEDLPSRVILCADRDQPGTYVQIVEFPSYEAAMRNSSRPETAEFAGRMATLCEGEPSFRNLDLAREEAIA